MRQSLRTRLIFIFAGMIALTVLICWCMNLFLLPGFYEHSKLAQMDSMYQKVSSICKNVDWSDTSSEEYFNAFDKIDGLSANTSISVYIMTVNVNSLTGTWWVDYKYPSMSDRQKNVYRSQLEKYVEARVTGVGLGNNYDLLAGKDNYDIYKVFDERIGSNYIELIGGIDDLTEDGIWVYMRSNYQSMRESVNVSNQLLTYVGLFAVLVGIFVIFIISSSYTKPILRLAHHAKKMAELDFNARYEEHRLDEIGVLGNSMNVLSEKLEETISELKTANNELQLDIERKQEQEEMRSEFIANVSHELKTPIALIQGYAEGLQDNINDDEESREFYCEVIIDEANKMNKMVKNLLSLNELEFGNGQLHFERFDIVEAIQSVVSSADILGKEKNVTIRFQKPEPIYVWADEYMIEEVITNYISNAYHHVAGEMIIEIKAVLADDKVRISVFNSGNPIPEEEVDKIWGKFYKVDKARTREYGGNGIGLSIVKAIMEAHNQKYGVINYNNGVEFWFEAMV